MSEVPTTPNSRDRRFPITDIRQDILEVEAGFWELRSQLEALYGAELTSASLRRAGARMGADYASGFVFDLSLRSSDKPVIDRDMAAGLGIKIPQDEVGRSELAAQAFHDCVVAYQAAGLGQFHIEQMAWPIGQVLVHAVDTFESWIAENREYAAQRPICDYTAGILLGFACSLTQRRDLACREIECRAKGDLLCQFEIVPADLSEAAAVAPTEEGALASPEMELLDALFHRIPVGAGIFDRQGRLAHHNRRWEQLFQAYADIPALQLKQTSLSDLPSSGRLSQLAAAVAEAMSGQERQGDLFELELEGRRAVCEMRYAPLLIGDEVVGVLHTIIERDGQE